MSHELFQPTAIVVQPSRPAYAHVGVNAGGPVGRV